MSFLKTPYFAPLRVARGTVAGSASRQAYIFVMASGQNAFLPNDIHSPPKLPLLVIPLREVAFDPMLLALDKYGTRDLGNGTWNPNQQLFLTDFFQRHRPFLTNAQTLQQRAPQQFTPTALLSSSGFRTPGVLISAGDPLVGGLF